MNEMEENVMTVCQEYVMQLNELKKLGVKEIPIGGASDIIQLLIDNTYELEKVIYTHEKLGELNRIKIELLKS